MPAANSPLPPQEWQPPAPGLVLPPPDHVLSPRTGWTRAHWEAVADRLLDALVPYASPGFAQYRLPGRASWSGEHSDGLEGFARTFLLASFRIAGAHAGATGPLPPAVTERIDSLTQRYARGLTTGTDPDSPDAWPPITERSQPMVEAASIAIGLHETRPWLWDRLPDRTRQQVADWLAGFVGKHPVDNNWRLFQVVTEQFLASVGGTYRQSEIDAGLDRIEDWYDGDGWYRDGDGRNFDYYVGWAMHFYPLLWARIAGAGGGSADGGRVAAYRARLSRFLDDYVHFFGADGAPVHQGRSLTYRFAAVAPVWMGALAGASPLPPGLTRRLASGALRHFAERGAPDGAGLLRPGWYGPYAPVTQSYSGPASPYWASKGFLGLLLPPGDPVWTAAELPLPIEESDTRRVITAPGWLLHGTRADGIVRLLNHGTDHYAPHTDWSRDEPHYTKLTYTSRCAPLTGVHVRDRHLDAHVALLAPDGTASRRTVVRPLAVRDDRASSWYEARLPGDERTYHVTTTSLPYGACEVRVSEVDAPEGVAEGVTVRDGGHAVAGSRAPEVLGGADWALSQRDDGLTSVVVGLHGWRSAGVERAEDAHAFGPHAAVPYVTAPVGAGAARVWVTLVVLTGEALDAAGVARLRTGFRVAVTKDAVHVTVDGEPDRVVPHRISSSYGEA
ncbi:DUF2264 domain-containing protein [Streptantibioticus silvisoli]|uniref:DUF2264 domain-containing protein n=1 Tax=Streptantibioticus silvisoli TaxID=2705255 RepID=A0ABT6W145_9ACTN|nr:DUF2264 domain-containing protein [Streptantibioticus silvisoli]MDI5963231.1 DUF2264 domain-containing protein [Streptantibioticus silvisoli]